MTAPLYLTPEAHEGHEFGRQPRSGLLVTFSCGRRDVTDDPIDGPNTTVTPARRITGPVFGPFEYVEGTYNTMRVGPDGDILAVLQDGDWMLTHLAGPYVGETYSDWDTFAVEKETT